MSHICLLSKVGGGEDKVSRQRPETYALKAKTKNTSYNSPPPKVPSL